MSRFSGKQYPGARRDFKRKQAEANALREKWWAEVGSKILLSPEERLLTAILGPSWPPIPEMYDTFPNQP